MSKFVTFHDPFGREIYVRPDDVSAIRTPGVGSHERAMSHLDVVGQFIYVSEHPLDVKRILEHGA
jgi:hypothetical protein